MVSDKKFSHWYFDGFGAKKLQGRIRKKDAWMVEGNSNDYTGGSEMYTNLSPRQWCYER